MLVREVMSTHVDLIDPSTSLARAAALMRDDDVGALPIGDNDRLVGMLTDRDIVLRGIAAGADVERTQAGNVMTKGIYYCFDDQTVDEAADIMGSQQVRRLPVVNRDKRLVGIVSLGDISAKGAPRAAGESLEEICKPVH